MVAFVGVGKAGQMAADLDMEAAGGEGWGDDAELNMDEGRFRLKTVTSLKFNQQNFIRLY